MLVPRSIFQVSRYVTLAQTALDAATWNLKLGTWNSRRSQRRAATILEVMFAILVTSIGLLGAVSILPVASSLARRGSINDTIAAAGRAAVNRFDAMGMRRMERPQQLAVNTAGAPLNLTGPLPIRPNWIVYNTNLNPISAATYPTIPTGAPRYPWGEFEQYLANGAAAGNLPPARNWFGGIDSFCIDPRYMAANTTTTGSLPNVPLEACQFPQLTAYAAQVNATAPVPAMWRCNLYSGITVYSTPTQPLYNQAMSKVMADSVFVINDDISFERSDDRSKQANLPFEILSGTQFSGTSIFSRRRNEGHFSWMAMLVPEGNSTAKIRPELPFATYGNTEWSQTWINDLYTLSIVVFHDRPADLKVADDTNTMLNPINVLNERVVKLYDAPGVGIGGGEFELRATDIPTATGTPISGEAQLKIKPNDWICLSGQMKHQVRYLSPSNATNEIVVSVFKWYRVSDCEPEATLFDPTTGTWQRFVTLVGQDWPVTDPNNFDREPNLFNQHAIIVDGVVGVYEKSVRLEYDGSR